MRNEMQMTQMNDSLGNGLIYYSLGKGVYFFLATPTVRPRRPVVLVC